MASKVETRDRSAGSRRNAKETRNGEVSDAHIENEQTFRESVGAGSLGTGVVSVEPDHYGPIRPLRGQIPANRPCHQPRRQVPHSARPSFCGRGMWTTPEVGEATGSGQCSTSGPASLVTDWAGLAEGAKLDKNVDLISASVARTFNPVSAGSPPPDRASLAKFHPATRQQRGASSCIDTAPTRAMPGALENWGK